MSLHGDLLDQARHLARREPRRPRQASLRRAVSAAYYALFHLLCEAASRCLLGGRVDSEKLRLTVRRAFSHADMKTVSKAFAGGTVPRQWQAAVPGAVSAELRLVAEAFVGLQESRHAADYDLSGTFSRAEVYELVRRCEGAFAAWERCRSSSKARAFLVALVMHKHLKAP